MQLPIVPNYQFYFFSIKTEIEETSDFLLFFFFIKGYAASDVKHEISKASSNCCRVCCVHFRITTPILRQVKVEITGLSVLFIHGCQPIYENDYYEFKNLGKYTPLLLLKC